MRSPITGHRVGATTAVRCVDVAGLVAASILRKNPNSDILPFEHRVVFVNLSASSGVQQNADRLGAVGGGGTNCAAPLQYIADLKHEVDLVWMISDNESWVQSTRHGNASAMMTAWERIRQRNPNAKLVLLDIQPNTTTQGYDRPDVLNIGGFSDRVFDIVADFVSGRGEPRHLVDVIEAIEL
jgi:60 kDa SS-A/Ro ribonucleoprotein